MSEVRGGLGRAGWEAKVLRLRDMAVAGCLGCFGCWLPTPGQCVVDANVYSGRRLHEEVDKSPDIYSVEIATERRGIRAYLSVDGNQELEQQVLDGLAGRRPRQYGLLFLGDNNFLIDRLQPVLQREPAHWFQRVDADDTGPHEGVTRLTVTIDRADLSRTRSALCAPTLLASRAGLTLTQDQEALLEVVTRFNIEARYPGL